MILLRSRSAPSLPGLSGRALCGSRRVGCPVRIALAIGLVGMASGLRAQAPDSHWIEHSANDFGAIGLLQMPTARMGDDGDFRVGLSTQSPYNHLFTGLQLLPWLETGLRYTEVSNRLYGTEEFSGDQSYKDRGVDFRIRLLEEGEYLPAIAVGFQDIGGTGLFSSEYLVASRRFQNFDFTLGLAWGRAGSRGGIRNPFAAVSDSFEERPGEGTVDDANLGFDRWFSGEEIGLFGGVEWQSPIEHLAVKMELDGNDYESEALDNAQDVEIPVNLAINYRLGRVMDTSIGVERGNTVMVRVAFLSNWQNGFGPTKMFDPPSSPVQLYEQPELALRTEADTGLADPDAIDALRAELGRQNIELQGLNADDSAGVVTVWYSQTLTRSPQRATARVAQTLAVMLPQRYQTFVLVVVVGDSESSRVQVRRDDVDRALAYQITPEQFGYRVAYLPVEGADEGLDQADVKATLRYPRADVGMGPGIRQHIGGPDDFYFGQLLWRFNGTLSLSRRWNVASQVGLNLYNNFDGLTVRDTSELPPVRSEIVRYIKEGENYLAKLETNYIWSPAPNWFARGSAGIFEQMYGGVAGELLYRRPYAPWAVGINVNHVRKRDYDQWLEFLDYEVTTGHLTGYFELPFYDTLMTVSAGRYLAKDLGATLELSREFKSGIRAGVFATKTDVSSEEFGEGAFDKGFVLTIPFDQFFTRSTARSASFLFRPLTRDGGQKVRDGVGLYGFTRSGTMDPDESWDQSFR